MTPNKRPPWVDALRLIGESDLRATERDTVRAMLLWWNPHTGRLWPTVATIAEHLGRNVATVRRSIRALERLGIVEIAQLSRGGVDAGGRGKGHVYRLHLDRLNPRTERGLAGADNPCRRDPEPAPRRPQTRAGATPNPRPTLDKPSIQPSREQSKEPSADSAARGDGCMEGNPVPIPEPATPRTVRDALAMCGVRGPNLDTLASCDLLSPETVRREAAAVWSDAKARNKPAVLVARLAAIASITLDRRPPLSAQDQASIGRLEELRRTRGPAGGSADALGDLLPGLTG